MLEFKYISRVIGFFVLLIFIIPLIAKNYTTKEEIKPIRGIDKLTIRGKIMHLLVHFSQFPFESSLLLSVFLAVSFYFAKLLIQLEV
tara:strand:+ start:923 stop:1183 length:261 start_codon:yes stop_codon:yes gene_type:complete